MTLVRKNKRQKVNFEFNKEYIKVVTEKISSNDASFLLVIHLKKCILLMLQI